MWIPALLLALGSSAMPAGDVARYREVTGGTTIGTTAGLLTLDTIEEEAKASFELASGEVLVKEACRVLYFGGTELTTTAAETGDLRFSLDPNTGTYAIEPLGWCIQYASNVNGINMMSLGVAGVVDCVANSKLKLTSASLGVNLTEQANRTWLHLYRLPEWAQVYYGFRSSNLSTIGATFVDIGWNSDTLKDSSWTHSTSSSPENITWTGGATRALLILCLSVQNPQGTPDRSNFGVNVLKNGSAIDFGQATQFLPGSGGDIWSTCRMVIPIDLATNDVIKVQCKQFTRAGTQQVRVNQNRCAIAIVAMPGGTNGQVNWARIRNASDQGADNASDTNFASDTEDEKDAAFAHSTVTQNNEITLNRARRYLCGYHLQVDRTASSTGDDIAWDVLWRLNNASDLPQRGAGAFTEGAVSTLDYKDGSLSSAMIYRASAGDIIELRAKKFGSGADASAVFPGGTGVTKCCVWVFDLDDFTGINAIGGGEAWGSCEVLNRWRGEARTHAEAGGEAALRVARYVEGQGLGEAAGTSELTRVQRLEARGLGEASGTLALSKLYRLDAQAFAEAFGSAELTFAPAGGGAVQLLLEARGFGEAFGSAVLSTFARLEARGLGEAFGSAAPLVKRYVEGQGLGEAQGTLSLNRKFPVEGRTHAEATSSAQLVVLRVLEARAHAEAHGRVELVRRLDLEARALGEAGGTAAVHVKLALEGRTLGAALATLPLTVKRYIEGRALGEAHGVLLMIEDVHDLRVQLVRVRRVVDVFEITRVVDLTEVRRAVEEVRVPKEVL